MKRLKKSVATVLAFVMVWSLMSLQSFGATITKSTTWDFTKWTAQTLTSDYSYDNLTVTATSTKKLVLIVALTLVVVVQWTTEVLHLLLQVLVQ